MPRILKFLLDSHARSTFFENLITSTTNENKMYTVTVCGGGNAAHVILGLMGARPDVNVRLFDTLDHEIEQFEAACSDSEGTEFEGKIKVFFKDGREEMTGGIEKISSQPEEVIPGSDMIILAVPAFVHEIYMEHIAKHAKPDCIVGVMVAKGGIDWQFKEVFKDSLDTTEFFAMENLPWACRIRDYGHSAEILGTKLSLEVAVYSAEPEKVIEKLNDLIALGTVDDPATKLPHFSLAPNFLSCSLRGNLGHACIMYGRFHNWDMKSPFADVPLFYEGVDKLTADTLENSSLELMAIKDALVEQTGIELSSVIPAQEWLIKAYGDDIVDKRTLQSCITTNKSYQGLKHAMAEVEGGYVPSSNSRYLTEDIPFGIMVIRGIAEIVGVPTPTMDRVIDWNQRFMGKQFLVDGKPTGEDIDSTRAPQKYGISEPAQLI